MSGYLRDIVFLLAGLMIGLSPSCLAALVVAWQTESVWWVAGVATLVNLFWLPLFVRAADENAESLPSRHRR